MKKTISSMLNGKGAPLPESLFAPLRTLKRLSIKLTAVAAVLCGMSATTAQAQTDTLQLTATYQNGISTPAVLNFTESKLIKIPLYPVIQGIGGNYSLLLSYTNELYTDTVQIPLTIAVSNTGQVAIASDSSFNVYANYVKYVITQTPNNNNASVTTNPITLPTSVTNNDACSSVIDACERICNGAFDANSGCPNQQGMINLANNWYIGGFPANSNGSVFGSPDYYYSENPANCITPFSIPDNPAGYQADFNGNSNINGYAGIGIVDVNFAEMVSQNIGQPLLAGRQYFASFRTSLAENARFASNNLRIWVSEGAQQHVFQPTCNAGASGNIITNTTNWILISG